MKILDKTCETETLFLCGYFRSDFLTFPLEYLYQAKSQFTASASLVHSDPNYSSVNQEDRETMN